MDFSEDKTPAAFPSTRISLIQLAASPDLPGYRAAWERFFRGYWPPLYSWLRRRGSPPQDALDVLQSFFLKGLEGPILGKFDPSKGRLRHYLLACLKNHQREISRGEQKRPDRKAVPFQFVEGTDLDPVAPSSLDPDHAFDVEWARRVFSNAVHAVEALLKTQSEGTSHRVLREWVLSPQRPPMALAAKALGLTEGGLNARAVRLRKALREELLSQVSSYAGDGRAARDEVEETLKLLSSGAE